MHDPRHGGLPPRNDRNRARLRLALIVLLVVGVVAALPAGTVAGTRILTNRLMRTVHVAKSRTPINHIVIFVRENHSFDNMFGRFPGVNGTTKAHVGTKVVPLNHTPDQTLLDIGHAGDSAAVAVNGGRMNQFYKLSGAIQNGRDE